MTNLNRAARRRGALGDTVGASERGNRGDGLRGGKHVGAEVTLQAQWGVRATDIWIFLHCTRELEIVLYMLSGVRRAPEDSRVGGVVANLCLICKGSNKL